MTRQWGEPEIGERLESLRHEARRRYEGNSVQPPSRRRAPRPAPDATDLEKGIALAVELRGLISDAHTAVKDLVHAEREYRRMVSDAGRELADAMAEAANAELARWANHIQREQNMHSANLNKSVQAAQQAITDSLVEALIEQRADGKMQVRFIGAKRMDEQLPDPYPQAGLPIRLRDLGGQP